MELERQILLLGQIHEIIGQIKKHNRCVLTVLDHLMAIIYHDVRLFIFVRKFI